jgi:transmembrane sensor
MKSTISSINHREVEATAAAWLAKQDDTAAWRHEDDQALQAWLEANTAHRVAWLRLRQAWVRADQLRDAAADAASTNGRAAPPVPRTPVRRRAMQVFAGLSIAALVAVSANIFINSGHVPVGQERFATAVGARQDLTLADGSHVTLNTRTTARTAVTQDRRQFWLDEGEAFFDVRPDPRRPFVIVAGSDRITVLGTKFSVRHENGSTRVAVVEGRVRLDKGNLPKDKPSTASAILTRNDVAVTQAAGVAVTSTTPDEAQRELSWRQGVIEFENEPLAGIAVEFNRYSRRQLVVEGDAAQLKLSGRLAIDNLDAFLRLIDTGFGVKARQDKEKIYLSMK